MQTILPFLLSVAIVLFWVVIAGPAVAWLLGIWKPKASPRTHPVASRARYLSFGVLTFGTAMFLMSIADPYLQARYFGGPPLQLSSFQVLTKLVLFGAAGAFYGWMSWRSYCARAREASGEPS